MVIGDITHKIKDSLQTLSYGGGVYNIEYPAYYYDGTPIPLNVKLEAETDVVLERGEEVENMALLSTSDEYTITDLGSVFIRFGGVEGIDNIIQAACDRNHLKYDKGYISLESDVATTNMKINRYIKCLFEIELKAIEKLGINPLKEENHKSSATSEELMAYLNKNRK